jgi:DNA replicative helicase MCM subunit Mcm2 (Cdc46/Mcm family)
MIYIWPYLEASLNRAQGFPVFSTHVEANHLLRKGDLFATHNLTDEDKEEIRRLSRDPRITQRIVKSMAPSIHGRAVQVDSLTVSKPELKARLVSAIETRM